MQTKRLLGLFSMLIAMVGFTPRASQAAMIYLVSNTGQGVVEAEHYDTKVDDPTPESWETLFSPGAGAYANASGGQYIQALPDDATPSHTPGGTPYVDYVFRVPDVASAFGNYLLYFRAVGPDAGGDSLFWRVLKSSDSSLVASQGGAGVPVGGNSAWDTGTWNSTVTTIPISAAGDYIVRVTPREDGAAIDKLAFQLDSLTAPSNFGPAESPLFAETLPVPEPGTGLLLLMGLVISCCKRKLHGRRSSH